MAAFRRRRATGLRPAGAGDRRPHACAEAWAERLVTTDADPWVLSVAHQARGIVLRDQGPARARASRSSGGRSGWPPVRRPDREADVRATLGSALAMAGRTGARPGTARSRGGRLGDRPGGAGQDPDAARRTSGTSCSATARGLGRPGAGPARAPGGRRARLGGAHAQPDGPERTWHSVRPSRRRGPSSRRSGSSCEEGQAGRVRRHPAQPGHHRLLPGRPALGAPAVRRGRGAVRGRRRGRARRSSCDRCEALLAAGLAHEAVGPGVPPRWPADRCPAAVEAELLLEPGDGRAGGRRSRSGRRERDPARDAVPTPAPGLVGPAVRSSSSCSRATHRHGAGGRRLRGAAARVGGWRPSAAPRTRRWPGCSPGRLAAAAGLDTGTRALRPRRRVPTPSVGAGPSDRLARPGRWSASWPDDRRGVLVACRRGLDALDEHRRDLGSSELRALATRHGDELARLALRHAVRERAPRACWSGASDGGRTRCRSRRFTRRTTPSSPATSRPCATPGGGWPRHAPRDRPTAARLDDDRARLERGDPSAYPPPGGRVGRRRRPLRGRAAGRLPRRHDVRGARRRRRRAARARRRRADGSGTSWSAATAEAEQAVAFARFALRQAARGRPADLDDVGRRLEDALLGDAVTAPRRRARRGLAARAGCTRRRGRCSPPWPTYPVSVAPSAALWLRARAAAPQ